MKSQPSSTRSALVILAPLATMAFIACGDDTPVIPQPTTTTTGGGAGGTTVTTSSSNTGGMGGMTTTTSSAGGSGGDGGQGGQGGQGGTPLMLCEGPDTGTDTCDGETIALSAGDNLQLCGDLTSAANDYADPFCPGAGTGGDNVYNLTFSEAGSLRIQVRREDGSDLNPTLYARVAGACTSNDAFDTYGCWDFFSTDHEEFSVYVDPNDPFGFSGFHLFVDAAPDQSATQTTGGYHLDISFQTGACGDNVWDFNTEECEDGNTVNDDGCSSTCTIETTNLFDTCPGEPLPSLGSGNPSATVSSNNIGNSDIVHWDVDASATDTCEPPSTQGVDEGGQDRIYSFAATSSGTVTAKVGYGPNCQMEICEDLGAWDSGCWDHVIYAIDGQCVDNVDQTFCDPFGPDPDGPCPVGSVCTEAFHCSTTSYPNTQLACSDSEVLGPEEISFPVTMNQTYTVVVDGYSPFSVGPYNLCLDYAP